MRIVRVSLFFFLVVTLAVIGIAPGRIAASRKAHASARNASRTQAAKTRGTKPRRVRISSVQQQQGADPPLLLVPTATVDKQGLDGAGPPYLIPVLNTSTTTSVQITSVTADPTLSVTTNCATLAPMASCTISMTFTTQTLSCSGVQTGNIIIANNDPNNPSLTISANGYGSDENFQIKNLTDTTLNPAMLAAQLIGTGVTISNVTYTGSPVAAGTFHTGSSIVGFTDGIILSTGSVRSVNGPNCSSGITTASGYPGDTDLSTLIGQPTFDAAILEFDFVPTNPTIRFQYVFASDEYEEFVFQYNDVFAFFVNGQNVALIPQTSTPVSINNVNDGSTSVFGVPPVNPQFYINNDIQIFATPPIDTEMDGLTVVLAATAKVNSGVSNHIKLAIADALDDLYDSNVFVKAGSLSSSVVSLSPTGLAFGNINVGSTSSAQSITLSNVGTAALSGVEIAPDSNNFTVSNNMCGAMVAASATCTFSVAFTPQAQSTGVIQGVINVTDSAGDSPQPVTLSGTAVNGAFASISPLNLIFAPEMTGVTSPPQTVTITNTGTMPLTFGSVSNRNTDFKLTSNCVSASIPVNGTCTVTVTWTAPAAGVTLPETDAIALQDNAQNGGTQLVGLVGGATSTISLMPTTLAFGNQTVNTTSAAKTVTIMNTGSVTVIIPSIIAPAGFAETDNCVSSGGLNSGAMCTINVTFTPTSATAFTGNLTITDSAQGSPHTVMLSGTGTSAAPTLVSIAVTPAMATVAVNGTQQFTATGTFSDNSSKDVTAQSTWTSSDTETASVGAPTGLATGVAPGGPVTITATDGTIKGTAQLTVSSGPTLKSIAVTPSTATIAVNGTQQFTATGTFSDNSTKDVTTQSTWKSSNTEVATVGAGTGLATGVGVGGPVTITATDGTVSGTASLTVSNTPIKLTINPPPGGTFPPVAPGGTLPVGVVLTANPGTTGTVTFSCTTSSPTITCSPQPSSVTLSTNGPLQIAFVVETFCKGPTTTAGHVIPGGFGGGIGLLLLSLMVAGTTWMYRRNLRWAVSFALFVVIALGGVACNSLPRNPNGVTVPGNYQLFITATFNGQTVTAPTVNFVVD